MISHKELAAGRWNTFSLMEQLAHIGSEVQRAINAKRRGDIPASHAALIRGLELLELTVNDPKLRRGARREIVRTREALVDHFMGQNMYRTTDEIWERYYYQFAYAAAIQRGR